MLPGAITTFARLLGAARSYFLSGGIGKVQGETPIPFGENVSSDRDLGPHIITCRPLSMVKYISRQGLGWFVNWLILPIFGLPYLALTIGGVPLLLLPDDLGRLKAWLMLGSTSAVYIFLIWRLYWLPRKDYLILYQYGFRIRMGFRKGTICFPELHSIVVGSIPALISTRGLDPGVLIFVAPQTGMVIIRPLSPEELPVTLGSSLNLLFHNGTRCAFKNVILRFNVEDLIKFFSFIYQHYPHLFRVSDPRASV